MLTNEQIELRQRGVGGSEAAITVGLSDRMTARELFHVKRGELQAEDPGFPAWLGSHIEPVLARWYEEATGWRVRKVNKTRWHRDAPYMLGHYDGLVVGPARPDRRGIEFKLRRFTEGWGREGTDDVPGDVCMQVQQYMAISGRPLWDVVCLFAGVEMRRYTVPRDASIIDDLIDVEGEFAYRLLIDDPPDYDFQHPTTSALLSRLYPGTDGDVVQLDEACQRYHEVAIDARRRIATYKAVAEGAEAHLKEAMGYAAIGFLPDGSSYQRKDVHRKAYSVDATTYTTLRHKRGTR